MKMERALSWVMVAASLVAAAGLWYWAVKIYAPANTAKALSAGRPVGNNSDLYARWYGTRELLLRGRDPYSAEVTREIQAGFYGRPLDAARENDPRQQEGFAYPLYVVFLLAPFAHLPFSNAQQIFRWLLLLMIAASVPLWSHALRTRLTIAMLVGAMLLAIGSFPAVMEFYQQNLAGLAIFFLAAAMAALTREWLVLAGFLLALATIKPEISGLLISWLLFWSFARMRERGRLVLSFAITLAALTLCAGLCLPHWIASFLKSLPAYAATETDPSILQAIFPGWLAVIISTGFLLAVAFRAWQTRKSEAGSEQFGWMLALAGSSTLVLIPKVAAYNQLVLIPAFLLLIRKANGMHKLGLLARSAMKATFACQLWQWAAAVALVIASLLVPLQAIHKAEAIPLATLLAIPAVTALAVLLMNLLPADRP